MALIGLLSDSHGQFVPTRLAVELLVTQGARLLIHLGDLGSERVIDALLTQAPESGRIIPAHLVFGNADTEPGALGRYAAGLGIAVDDPMGRLVLDGKTILFTHGHDSGLMNKARQAQVDYLCHGHSHQIVDQHVGATHVINPGALFRAQALTVALLDTEKDQVRFHTVAAG
ncbi:MAG: YfcE family phosphodiesterase [Phycisphaeraceae bacterium]|nr:YfcE family phosphodiesterase [Phycisphaeraceae bacterium]